MLRAAGDRAFSAGLDTSKSFGQPDLVWNHDDPGELLSPKWQKCWKPVVCAVHGMCTAGALYFVNEADVVVCSDDATFFDSHVTYGYVSALEPIGLMRRIGLGDTLRMALWATASACPPTPRCASAWSPRSCRARSCGTTRPRDRRRHRSYPAVATQGTVRAIWESLDKPYRAAMDQGLMYTRLGNPVGLAEIAAHRRRPRHRPGSGEGRRRSMTSIPSGSAQVMALDPSAPALEFEGEWSTWGELGAAADAVDAVLAACGLGAGAPVGLMLRNRPVALGMLLGLLRAGACVVTVNPLLGAERLRADLAGLGLPLVLGAPDDLALVPAGALPATARGELGALGAAIAVDRRPRLTPAESDAPGVAVRMLTSGTTGPPKRIDLRYEMLELVMRGAKHYETATGDEVRLRSGVVIVNAPLVHVSGVFRVVQAMLDGRRIALLERFTVDGWIEAVREHRPKTVSLVPTALRMVLDADLDDDVFASIRSVDLGHRAARSRSRRGVHRALRRARATSLRRHRVRRRGRRLEPRRPRAVRGRQAGERRARARRLLAAGRRPRRRRRARHRRRRACSRCAPRSSAPTTGCAPPISPASTPTASSGSSAGPTRPSSAAGTRCSPRSCGPRSNGCPAWPRPRWWAWPTIVSARCRSPRWSVDRARPSTRPRCWSSQARTWRGTRCRCR